MEGIGNMNYFSLEESFIKNKFLLRVNCDNFPIRTSIKGSFNILPARLLGLTFANYIRFCRDVLGAEVFGKNSYYPTIYFPFTKEVNQFIKLLNTLAKNAIFENEHPYSLRINKNGELEKYEEISKN